MRRLATSVPGLALFGVITLGVGSGVSVAQGGPPGPAVEIVSAAVPPGAVRPSSAFAALPFRAEDAQHLKITSGWKTAEDEQGIIGDPDHNAIDFEGVECGKPVLAMADGWAIATYQSGVERGAKDAPPPLKSELWTDPITHRTGYLGYGGLVVEIQFAQPDLPVADAVGGSHPIAQYFHLGSVSPWIKWLPPVRAEKDQEITGGGYAAVWNPPTSGPDSLTQSQEVMRKIATPVKKGDIIGYMGDVGVNFGYDDAFDPMTHTVSPRDRMANPPWDPQGAGATVPIEQACQLHMFWYAGRNANGSKVGVFDGLGKYDQITGWPGTGSYNNPDNPRPRHFVFGEGTVFESRDRRLVFAG